MTEANIFRACHSVEGVCAGTATELATTTKRAASRSKQGTLRSPDADMPEFRNRRAQQDCAPTTARSRRRSPSNSVVGSRDDKPGLKPSPSDYEMFPETIAALVG